MIERSQMYIICLAEVDINNGDNLFEMNAK